MKFSSIKSRALLALGATLCAAIITGCGGGSSNGPTPPPTPTAIPPTNVNVLVQLRDTAGAPVEGLVTLDGQRRATTGGDAAFTNVKSGSLVASAEVNGATYSQNFVATSGANTVQIAVDPATTPPDGGNPPAPPF